MTKENLQTAAHSLNRDDLSDYLVHLTKGEGNTPKEQSENAAGVLIEIVSSRKLIGNNGYITGKYNCVCFSETPPQILAKILAEKEDGFPKYQPYGIMYEKKSIFSLGGRPVIYGQSADFSNLPEEQKYRHVTFDLSAIPPIDFTWEREWRLKIDELPIKESDVWIVVPNKNYEEVFSETLGNNWKYLVLSDFDITVPGFEDIR